MSIYTRLKTADHITDGFEECQRIQNLIDHFKQSTDTTGMSNALMDLDRELRNTYPDAAESLDDALRALDANNINAVIEHLQTAQNVIQFGS